MDQTDVRGREGRGWLVDPDWFLQMNNLWDLALIEITVHTPIHKHIKWTLVVASRMAPASPRLHSYDLRSDTFT
jgi:hypothetical protein